MPFLYLIFNFFYIDGITTLEEYLRTSFLGPDDLPLLVNLKN